jgi:hypothetical protein
MTTPPHLEYYASRSACPRHGTMNKLSASGQCVTCASLANWKRRDDARDLKIACEAVTMAADNIEMILKCNR